MALAIVSAASESEAGSLDGLSGVMVVSDFG